MTTLLKHIKKYLPDEPAFLKQSSLQVDRIKDEFRLRMVYPSNGYLNYKSGEYDVYIFGDCLAAIPTNCTIKDIIQSQMETINKDYNEFGRYSLTIN